MLVEEVLQLLYFSGIILFMYWHPLFLINFSKFRPDDGSVIREQGRIVKRESQ